MAVTGGSGVVGAAVVRHLVESGDEVVAVARSDTSAAALAALGARPVPGDVTNHAAMVAAFEGAEVVYHVAGVNELCSLDPSHVPVNVGGTRIVLRACAAAGWTHGLTSSASTIGTWGDNHRETPHRGTTCRSTRSRSTTPSRCLSPRRPRWRW